MRKAYMYYETDGDSGYYGIKIFASRKEANKYKKLLESGYGHVTKISIIDKVEKTSEYKIKEEELRTERTYVPPDEGFNGYSFNSKTPEEIRDNAKNPEPRS